MLGEISVVSALLTTRIHSFVGKRRAWFHPGMQHVQNPTVCFSTASTRMSKMDKEELSNR